MAQQPVVFDRQKTGFMRPVFEQLALRRDAFVEPLLRIGAEPAKEHEIRTARDHVNRVDLQLRHAADCLRARLALVALRRGGDQ